MPGKTNAAFPISCMDPTYECFTLCVWGLSEKDNSRALEGGSRDRSMLHRWKERLEILGWEKSKLGVVAG